MKKRFIVAVDSSTPEQEQAFREWIAGRGWWHWLNNFWLIADSSGEMTASEILDRVRGCYPNVDCVVLELRPDGTDTWAAFGPYSDKRNMFNWLRRNWKQ